MYRWTGTVSGIGYATRPTATHSFLFSRPIRGTTGTVPVDFDLQ